MKENSSGQKIQLPQQGAAWPLDPIKTIFSLPQASGSCFPPLQSTIALRLGVLPYRTNQLSPGKKYLMVTQSQVVSTKFMCTEETVNQLSRLYACMVYTQQ